MSLCDKRYGALAQAEVLKTDILRALIPGPFIALESLQDGAVPVGWKHELETKQRHSHPHQTKESRPGDRRPTARVI